MIDVLPSKFIGDFHHLGYATTSIATEMKFFEMLGYKIEGDPFEDPNQGISGCFMTGPGPRIELLENLAHSDTLTPWLKAGVKVYHSAYVVKSLPDMLSWAKEHRGKVIAAPVNSVAFEGRQIAFVMFRHGMMIEFIESDKSESRESP